MSERVHIIRIAVAIVWYYVISFIVAPIDFGYSLAGRKFKAPPTSYDKAIDRQIEKLREIMAPAVLDPVTANEANEANEENLDSSQKSTEVSIQDQETVSAYDELSESLLTEFDDHNMYSLKIDSIGRYDARLEPNSQPIVHVNLKRKTIDILDKDAILRIPLQKNQIIVTSNES